MVEMLVMYICSSSTLIVSRISRAAPLATPTEVALELIPPLRAVASFLRSEYPNSPASSKALWFGCQTPFVPLLLVLIWSDKYGRLESLSAVGLASYGQSS